jgi:hypothetical protein
VGKNERPRERKADVQVCVLEKKVCYLSIQANIAKSLKVLAKHSTTHPLYNVCCDLYHIKSQMQELLIFVRGKMFTKGLFTEMWARARARESHKKQ